MRSTEKENKKIIERMEFDDYAYAQQVRDESKKKLNKIKIALPISLIPTLCCKFIMEASDASDFVAILVIIGVIGGVIVSYILGGGIKIMARLTMKVALLGWFICPFPLDIATGLFTMCCAPIFFIGFPGVFILLNLIQTIRNKKDAEEYMSFCRPVEEIV